MDKKEFENLESILEKFYYAYYSEFTKVERGSIICALHAVTTIKEEMEQRKEYDKSR